MGYRSRSKNYQRVQYYIEKHCIPNKIGRVVYYPHQTGGSQIVELIKSYGLTPIPLLAYREIQANMDDRVYSYADLRYTAKTNS